MTCPECGQEIITLYCGPCDTFYPAGHTKDCADPEAGAESSHQYC